MRNGNLNLSFISQNSIIWKHFKDEIEFVEPSLLPYDCGNFKLCTTSRITVSNVRSEFGDENIYIQTLKKRYNCFNFETS